MDLSPESKDTCYLISCTKRATETIYWTTKSLAVNNIKIQTCRDDKENITNTLEYISLVNEAAIKVTGFDIAKKLNDIKLQELTHPNLRLVQDCLYNINNGFVDLKLMIKQNIVNSNQYGQLLHDHEIIKHNMSTIYNML